MWKIYSVNLYVFGFLTAVKNFAKLVLSFAPNLLIPYTVKPMQRSKTSGVNAKFSTVGAVFYTILFIFCVSEQEHKVCMITNYSNLTPIQYCGWYVCAPVIYLFIFFSVHVTLWHGLCALYIIEYLIYTLMYKM